MDFRQLKIETERLILEPLSIKFAEQIFLEYREPVTTYMNYGPPESLGALQERIRQQERELRDGKGLLMVVLKKDSEEFLGRFVLENIDKKNPEMGGWLKKSAQGYGYGREAAAALKDWADRNLQYDYILWPCATLNTPSRKLAESLGGTIRREYEKKTASGNVWDYVHYWIPKEDT